MAALQAECQRLKQVSMSVTTVKDMEIWQQFYNARIASLHMESTIGPNLILENFTTKEKSMKNVM